MGYPDPDPVEKKYSFENGVLYHARNCADPIGRYYCDCGAADLTKEQIRKLAEQERTKKESGGASSA